jgi:hypothetical protein
MSGESTWPGNDGSRIDYDPSHGRIDKDIQEQVDQMRPGSLGARVAMENTLQERRNGEWPCHVCRRIGPLHAPDCLTLLPGEER